MQGNKTFCLPLYMRFFILFAAVSAVCIGVIRFFDQQVVDYFSQHSFIELSDVKLVLFMPVLLAILSAIYLLVFNLCSRSVRTKPLLSKLDLMAVSVLCVLALKNILKILFGRTWPNHQPSFFPDDNLAKGFAGEIATVPQGFYPFSSLREFAAFPSGSTAIAVVAAWQIWVLFPKLRPFAVFLGVSVPVSLLVTNIHYLSDIIAGYFLGASAGYLALNIYREK